MNKQELNELVNIKQLAEKNKRIRNSKFGHCFNVKLSKQQLESLLQNDEWSYNQPIKNKEDGFWYKADDNDLRIYCAYNDIEQLWHFNSYDCDRTRDYVNELFVNAGFEDDPILD